MTRPLLILLMVCSGCGISRQSYLRDRLQDSLDKQEQQSLNAEILRSMDSFQSRWNKIQIERIEALEKKMDEPPRGTIVHADSGLNLPDCLINGTCTILVENFHGELRTSTKTLEITVEELTDRVAKKLEERKEPCSNSGNWAVQFSSWSISWFAVSKINPLCGDEERPNFPCPYCDQEKK